MLEPTSWLNRFRAGDNRFGTNAGAPRRDRGGTLRNPARLGALAFAAVIGVGTSLLMLPIATHGAGGADVLTAAFTATSAVCVTGLVVVDTDAYWTGFGEAVLLGLMQVGGLGVMTFASLLGVLVSRRLGLRTRMLAHSEIKALDPGTIRRVLVGIVVTSLVIEAVVWLVLSLRFWLGYGESLPRAVYLGLFHAISAYNNAGFALWSDSVVGFAGDPLVVLPLAAALVLGGIGYPVLVELRRNFRPRQWSLHTRLTVYTSAVLLVVGPLLVLLIEWKNRATLGDLPVGQRLLSGWFSGVTPRTAGFNSIDYSQADPATLLTTDVLMLIGGGSGGTAGGIKVTTLAVLVVAVVAEMRGDPDVDVFDRRLSPQTVRQALALVTLAVATIGISTFALLAMTDFTLDHAAFEVTSALATVGLSTGITADIPAAGQILLIFLMFLGRVGPITVASALAMRSTPRAYRNPEARPIIG